MNKVYLKRFFKNQSIEELRNKYVKYNDCYLISNNYSILLLNSDYGLLEKCDNKYENMITSCFKEFDKYNESDINIINDLDECKEKYHIPNELLERKECEYGINFNFIGFKILYPSDKKERQEKVSNFCVKKFVSYM